MTLRNENDFYINPCRIELVKRLPFTAIPTAWNATDDDVKLIQNRISFKITLKKNLIDSIKPRNKCIGNVSYSYCFVPGRNGNKL